MALSKRIRFEVLRRDSHTCRYCGATAADGAKLTIDHVTPVALGGTDDPSNLVAACADCNAGKTSTTPDAPLVAQVADDAVRWARAMAQAADEAASDRQAREAIVTAVDETWLNWTAGYVQKHVVPRPDDWRRSISQISAAGLSVTEMVELVDVAMNSKASDPWRYFCGCCWTRLRQIQERAKQIVAAEDPPERPNQEWCIHLTAEECPHDDAILCAVRDAQDLYHQYVYNDEASRVLADVIDLGYEQAAEKWLEYVFAGEHGHFIWRGKVA